MSFVRLLAPWLMLSMAVGACALVAVHADREARRTPATCAPNGCYCEAVAAEGVRQPVDAWSSLAPALAGALVLAWTLGPRPREGTALARSRTPGVLLALAASAIAVFSFHYHATLTWLGEWLDGVALYLLAGFGLAWAVARGRAAAGRVFALAYLVVALVPAALTAWMPALRKPAFVVVALAAIVVELVARKHASTQVRARWLAVALASFALAATAWLLDWHRVVCAPDSVLQLHALWHLASAPTVLALYAYFRSERPRERAELVQPPAAPALEA
jgi:hypothetical protein